MWLNEYETLDDARRGIAGYVDRSSTGVAITRTPSLYNAVPNAAPTNFNEDMPRAQLPSRREAPSLHPTPAHRRRLRPFCLPKRHHAHRA